jgi:hypothetical protein
MEATETPERELTPEEIGHPRGTMFILFVYGLLFGLGWLAMFFFTFVPRGTPHP